MDMIGLDEKDKGMPSRDKVAQHSKSKNGRTLSRKQTRASQWELRRKDGDVFYVKKNGDIVKVPSSGPPNSLILSGSIFPFPKEETSQ